MQHFPWQKKKFSIWREKCEWHLWYANDDESDTSKSEYNMKITLIKVKETKSDCKKDENYTCESEGVQKCQFEKLTKIKVQMH